VGATRGVTRLDGARGKKFNAPMFELDVFRKAMYCIEESACDNVGTFLRPHIDSAPGELSPPRSASGCNLKPDKAGTQAMKATSSSSIYSIHHK